MIELKYQLMLNKDMSWVPCYIKSEADKVIAELKAQKAQAEDDCAYWKMREGNAVNAMHETEEACMFLTKSERHQKYKRCLAMARMCERKRVDAANYRIPREKWEFYEKWHKRWLKIAEKFEPNNSTAQQGKG